MKFRDFIEPLLEGGKAIKNVEKISQEEVRKISGELIKKIAEALNIKVTKVKLIGSAGRKPDPSDLSGDLDIAVECEPEVAEAAIKKLASNGSFRSMRGINVFSFAHEVGNKFVQVDLMPVQNIKFAEWSYQANPEDLKQGLKGAQRNELFFAIAKNMPQEVIEAEKDGTPIVLKRFFYDLSKGLMEGIKSRKGKKKALMKNFSTTEKKLITDDPEKITKMMFGSKFNASQVETFDGTLKVIRSEDFQYHDQVSKILDLAKKGITDKGLKLPDSL